MKIIKLLSVLLLMFVINAAVPAVAAESERPAAKTECSFWDWLFGCEEDDEPDLNAQVMPEIPKPEEESKVWIMTKLAAHHVLRYFANLLGDLGDIVTVELSVGNTFAVDAHATYFVDLGLEKTDAYFCNYGPFHRYGGGRREVARAAFLCWSREEMYISQIEGKNPSFTMTDPEFNLVRYRVKEVVNADTDCWAIGFRLAMFFGIAVDLHLVEIPDFFCQLVDYDLYGDNWQVLFPISSSK